MSQSALVDIANLSKTYGGVHALTDVSLAFQPGEVHALCGENGAGKSSLIKCVSGVVVPDSGSILVDNKRMRFGNVAASESAGIAVIHQESTAFPDLNTFDNIFAGREPCWMGGCLLDRRKIRHDTDRLLERLGQTFNTRCPVGELSLAERQMVALARALSHDCKLLILDEPTASLSARETETLLTIVRRLRDEGVAILYVSHRLEEVFEIADVVTVLRDGCHITTQEVSQISRDELIRFMVGRDVAEYKQSRKPEGDAGRPLLEVRGLSRGKVFEEISFSVRAGEIVGLAGLVGAGRSEVARAIFGIDDYDSGEIRVDGLPLAKSNVATAMKLGLGLVPEDRQHEGLLLPMTVRENVSLTVLERLTRWGMVRYGRERKCVQSLLEKLSVKAASQESAVETLSGGNQQKVVLAKWLATNPKVLILDEPTRGVDVGAKSQVHQVIRRLAADGMAGLVVSSELPELLAICDRIIVMRQGRLSGELMREAATEEAILQLALPDVTSALSSV